MRARMISIGWISVVLALGQVASGQDNPPPPQPENPMRAIEIQRKQAELEQYRTELYFNNEMQKIELEKKRLELNRERQMLDSQGQPAGPGKGAWRGHPGKMKHFCGLMLICAIVHILLAIWVYQDIRHRNAGSGLWIIVTLLTGLLGTLVYALVRLGDKPA